MAVHATQRHVAPPSAIPLSDVSLSSVSSVKSLFLLSPIWKLGGCGSKSGPSLRKRQNTHYLKGHCKEKKWCFLFCLCIFCNMQYNAVSLQGIAVGLLCATMVQIWNGKGYPATVTSYIAVLRSICLIHCTVLMWSLPFSPLKRAEKSHSIYILHWLIIGSHSSISICTCSF